jgi:hypothetical protein
MLAPSGRPAAPPPPKDAALQRVEDFAATWAAQACARGSRDPSALGQAAKSLGALGAWLARPGAVERRSPELRAAARRALGPKLLHGLLLAEGAGGELRLLTLNALLAVERAIPGGLDASAAAAPAYRCITGAADKTCATAMQLAGQMLVSAPPQEAWSAWESEGGGERLFAALRTVAGGVRNAAAGADLRRAALILVHGLCAASTAAASAMLGGTVAAAVERLRLLLPPASEGDGAMMSAFDICLPQLARSPLFPAAVRSCHALHAELAAAVVVILSQPRKHSDKRFLALAADVARHGCALDPAAACDGTCRAVGVQNGCRVTSSLEAASKAVAAHLQFWTALPDDAAAIRLAHALLRRSPGLYGSSRPRRAGPLLAHLQPPVLDCLNGARCS